jgi:hypothetical protein
MRFCKIMIAATLVVLLAGLPAQAVVAPNPAHDGETSLTTGDRAGAVW